VAAQLRIDLIRDSGVRARSASESHEGPR
jgi:hypothetical protein